MNRRANRTSIAILRTRAEAGVRTAAGAIAVVEAIAEDAAAEAEAVDDADADAMAAVVTADMAADTVGMAAGVTSLHSISHHRGHGISQGNFFCGILCPLCYETKTSRVWH